MCRCCQPYQRKLAVRTRTNNLTDLRSATPPDSTAMSGRRSWQVRQAIPDHIGQPWCPAICRKRGAFRGLARYRSCACSAARCRAAHSPSSYAWLPARSNACRGSASSTVAVNLASRSRMRNRNRWPASSRSMIRLRASWVSQAPVGCAVTPRMWTRRVACSMTKNAYSRCRVMVSRWNRSQARMPWAWARRNSVHEGPARRDEGIDAGVVQDCPDGGGADLVAEAGEFAVPGRGGVSRCAAYDRRIAACACSTD